MTLVQLEYYIGACECGNITKAAGFFMNLQNKPFRK